MMETCPTREADRPEPVDSDRLRTEVLSEFSTLPELQHSGFKEKEHLQVYLRIRPFTSAESESGESQDCVTIEPPDTVLLKPPNLSLSARLSTERSLLQTGQRFQFSKVYGPETTQRELFEGTVKDLVKDVLDGGNSLVFTYGVTNAGKTFTFLGPDADAGILPRSLEVIFSSIDDQIFPGMSIKPHRCREFTRLSREQQAEEAAFKRNLLRQLKESQRSNVSLLNSTNKTLLEASSMPATSVTAEDKISLELQTHTKFSVWVSFCEIYNENIHDLLEVAPSGALRRTALRLSQDVKGDAFVKDLRWVQVSSAEEAYKVMKLGKKNQSFSSTRLNQLSSRSHSIFSIRILRIEDVGTPRVHTVSELSLCDLAGSERCAKTQNKGERLKEAGNINTSLLILGKCINALRHNQQAKLLQHVPFRESKLTHYLQGFFCGRGKACMIVNINQCASIYDETLNVLKFSAVAQKVVVLSSRLLPIMPQRPACETSFSTAERKALRTSRRSSLIGWDSSLEDVQEDEDDECEEESLMDVTMDETCDNEDGDDANDPTQQQRQAALLKRLQMQLKKERAESLLMEARVREEVSREFSELLSAMQNDHDERLAREREILEERAERKLEIFKNLIDKLASAQPGPDPQAMGKPLDSSELAGIKKAAEAAHKCLGSGRGAAARGGGGDQLQVQEQMAHKHSGGSNGKVDEEKRRPLSLLQEAPQGRSMTAKEGFSREGERLQEALAALEKERKGREDALAALEYQTIGKEEALASLEEERKAKEEAVAALEEMKRSKEEALASLQEERKGNEEAAAALGAERKAKADAMAALKKEQQSREEMLATLSTERRGQEEAESKLEEDRKEISRLVEESDALRQEVRELTVKLEAAEQHLADEAERAERASVQLLSTQTELDQQSKEVQEKTAQILTLTQEVLGLKQEVQTSATSGGVCDQLRVEVSELQKNLSEEKEKNDGQRRHIVELELQLAANKQLVSEQPNEEEEAAASKQEAEELRVKLQQREETWRQQLDELRAELEGRQQASREEAEQIRAKLEEQTQASEKQVDELKEKLREQEEMSRQQVEELKRRLSEQEVDSAKLSDELRQKLHEQEEAAELLRAEVEEARLKGSSAAAAEEHLKKLTSDLQAEVASLKAKISSMEETKANLSQSDAQLASAEEEKEQQLAELQKASKEKEAELQKKLHALQKSLEKAQERREEEESQAVQEARRREAERRRELLAVAHEAIAQKDEELEKKAEEIRRMKENAERDSEAAKSLSLDLQRKAEETSDLREKLADYKKQVQQVQKEISAMREDERLLRQKLSDAEKVKKQLQCDVASRDRSLQQLRAEQSSESKSDQTLQLYQKACKDLEAKERVMEDMRLALTEQEETQDQMEQALEEKLHLIQELSGEVESLKGLLLQQERGNNTLRPLESPSHELKVAKQEAAQAQENLKLCAEKQQAERKKWLEEKLSLIGQAKEAEDKRNQEMRKFMEDRERYARQQSHMEALTSQLAEKDQTMEAWRRERDTLVAALEVQLQKLLSSQAEKDQLIRELRQSNRQQPPEGGGGGGGGGSGGGADGVEMAALQAALSEKEAEILRLQDELKAATAERDDTATRTDSSESPATQAGKPQTPEAVTGTSGGRRDTRASVSSQGSAGCPSVLESSEISTENGRTSRFPRPELEISFSPLQPNRVALRRQGEESAVTVKITRSARKRKSGEMEKEEVEAENRRNTRTKLTPKLTPHQEEISSPAGRHGSPSSTRSRKEGTLQKIGGFLQSSPTLLGSKAKKMMSLVSGRPDADSAASSSSSSSSLSLTAKKSKRKLYRPEISSPMDLPSHPIISSEPAEKESDHQLVKRRLRSRMVK